MSKPNGIGDKINRIMEKREAEDAAKSPKSKSSTSQRTRTKPKIEEPVTPPRRTSKPPRVMDDFESDDDDEDDSMFTLSTIPKKTIPKFDPKVNMSYWQPGNVKRTVAFEKGLPKSATEEFVQSNLDHMERIANRQHEDARQRRDTYAMMQRESEERAYADRERARQMELEKQKLRNEQRENDNRLSLRQIMSQFLQDAKKSEFELEQQYEANRQRMREENAKIEQQRMAYDKDIAKQRAAFEQQREESRRRKEEQQMKYDMELVKQKALWEQQRDESHRQHERELAKHRAAFEQQREESRRRKDELIIQAEEKRRAQEAKIQAQEQQLAYQRQMALDEQDTRRQDIAQKQQVARWEFDDRSDQRRHTRDMELGLARMYQRDRQEQRNYEMARARLDRVTDLAKIYQNALDNNQRRYFNGLAFHDSRVANHVKNVNIDREQRGLRRQREMYDIFEEFNMGDPDVVDLSEPNISIPVRRLNLSGRRSYLHSVLVTGVDEIVHKKETGQVYIIFTNGTRKELPGWRRGYAIATHQIAPYVYIFNVFKQTTDMVESSVKRRRPENIYDDDDDSIGCPICCRKCNVICDVQ